jgi:hypothetical protein
MWAKKILQRTRHNYQFPWFLKRWQRMMTSAVLSQSLSEEKAMVDWIKTNAPDILIQLWPEIEASIAQREAAQIIEREK